MGTSVNGIIFFGISFDEGEEENWVGRDAEGGEVDWPNHYADLAFGIKPLTVKYEGNEEIYSKHWRDVREANDKSLCEVDYHCSSDCSMYFVAVKRTYITSSWGYPEEINPEMFKVTEEEIQALKEFCEIMSIPYSEPKWHLASYWG